MLQKHRIGKISVMIIILSLFLTQSLFSQDKSVERNDKLWSDVRFGAVLGEDYMNAVIGSINVEYSLYGAFTIGIRGLYGINWNDEHLKNTELKDFGLKVGFSQIKDNFKFSIFSGITYLKGNFLSKDFSVYNLPLEADVFYVGKRLGFGISIFDNINSAMNYYGMSIGFLVIIL
ncbi:MAG: hypothetical protein HW421_1658 [Ignavibacteria bacterium]|nr:hypothetical protein [Ignavibacteria bacterium]